MTQYETPVVEELGDVERVTETGSISGHPGRGRGHEIGKGEGHDKKKGNGHWFWG